MQLWLLRFGLEWQSCCFGRPLVSRCRLMIRVCQNGQSEIPHTLHRFQKVFAAHIAKVILMFVQPKQFHASIPLWFFLVKREPYLFLCAELERFQWY